MGVFVYDIAPATPNEAAREAAVDASGALSLMGHPVLATLTRRIARLFDTRFATVSIVVRDWQYLIGAHGVPTGVTRRSSSFCAHAVARPHRPLVVLDARADERFAENPNVIDTPAIRFYASAALMDSAEIALGTLCVYDSDPRAAFPPLDAAKLSKEAARTMALLDALVADARDADIPRRATA